jgi:hypothetical protein
MKVEFVSIDEEGKHYSLRTADGKVHFGREYLDSCFIRKDGSKFTLELDEVRAKQRLERRAAKKRKF